MRIECPTCLELIEAKLIRVAGRSATFVCGPCSAEASVELADALTTPGLAAVDQNVGDEEACPKCDEPVPSASIHCPTCGLHRQKFSNFDSKEIEADPALTSAWDRVRANWDVASVHEDFATQVALTSCYRLGALWYRKAAANHEHAEKARQMLDRIQSMATAALLSTKPKISEENQPYKGVLILLMVMFFLSVGVGIILMSDNSASPAQQRSQSGRK